MYSATQQNRRHLATPLPGSKILSKKILPKIYTGPRRTSRPAPTHRPAAGHFITRRYFFEREKPREGTSESRNQRAQHV